LLGIWVLDYIGGVGLQGVVLSIQACKPTYFWEAKFASFPKLSHKLAHEPIPWKSHEKITKKLGNN
jgi:hypothetical protein